MMLRPLFLLALALGGGLSARGGLDAAPWAYTAPPRRQAPALPQGEPLPGQAAKYYTEASSAFARGDATAAEPLIEDALRLMPGHPLVQGLAARIFSQRERPGLALDLWNQLVEQYPGNGTLLAERAATLLLLDRRDDAERDIRRAQHLSPADLTTRYVAALWHAGQGRLDDATAMFAVMPGHQVLECGERLLHERRATERMLSPDGYRIAVRALLNPVENADLETLLPACVRLLQELKPLMEAQAWGDAEQALVRVRAAGAGYPALFYDLALCGYLLRPSAERLARIESFVLTPRGGPFARYFIYLTLHAGDLTTAQRVLDAALANARDEEAVLIRAAIAGGQGRVDDAWATLEQIPPALRPATRPWFSRNLPAIRALRDDPRFDAWIGDSG